MITPGAGIDAEYLFIEYHSGDAMVFAVDGDADARFPSEAYLDRRLRGLGAFTQVDDLGTALREDELSHRRAQAVRDRDRSSVSVRAERAAADLLTPTTASRHLIEYAVLRAAGLGRLADELVAQSNGVSARARRAVTALLRERYGARRPQLSGAHSLAVFLLTFAGIVPAGLLGMTRFGAQEILLPAAVAACVVGVLQLVVSLLVVGKPVPRSTLIQAQVSAVLSVGVGVIGTGFSGDSPAHQRWLFLIGAAGALLALVLYLVGRRDRVQRQRIDDALETAYLDVSADVEVERRRILDALARELENDDVDLDELRAVRAVSFRLLQESGNPVVDDQPDSLPGYYLVLGHTEAWLPPSRMR